MTPRASLGRVLIADDEEGVRKSLTAALSRAGFEVIAVDDGAPAIALADGGAAVEIVLVDLHMRTGGLTVIRHYKQRHGAGVYCAVPSDEDDAATREGCLAAGPTRCSASRFQRPSFAAGWPRPSWRCVRQLRVNEARSRLNFSAGSASLCAGNGRHCHTGKGDGGRG